jgi:hypothetical protein
LVVAGAASVVFELVESFMVGNVLTPPAGISGPGYAALWLQPVYIAVGVPMLLLGGAVPSRLGGFPARASAIVSWRSPLVLDPFRDGRQLSPVPPVNSPKSDATEIAATRPSPIAGTASP